MPTLPLLAGLMLTSTLTGCTNDLSNDIFQEDADFLAALPSREVFQVAYLEDDVTWEPLDEVLLLDTTLGAIQNADDWLLQAASITDALRDLVPAVRKSDYREWGPYEYQFLDSPLLYLRVEVTRSLNEASYTYNYYWSTSSSDDSTWTRFFVGHHYIGETIQEGDGTMEWELNGLGAGGSGTVTAEYNLREELQLLVSLNDAALSGSGPYRAKWFFQRTPDGGGDLEYYAFTDFNPTEPGSEEELMAVRTRWLSDGTGRADAILTEGDLFAETDATMVQCWTSEGSLTAQLITPAYLDTVGDPEVDCPYPDIAAVENLPAY